MTGPAEVKTPAPVPVASGTALDQKMQYRKDLTELKSKVNAVNTALGIMLTDLTNAGFRKKRDDAVAALNALSPKFVNTAYTAHIEGLVKFATGSEQSIKKKIHELATNTTRQITKDLKTNMAEIKALKKAASQ